MVLDSLPQWMKTFGYALALSTGFELLYYLKHLRDQKREKEAESSAEVRVIFFPDSTVACEAHFSYGCKKQSCWLSHQETAAMKVLNFISSAKRTLDLCVYSITSHLLVDSVIKVQEQGLIIRVITDQQQASESSSMTAIAKLRAAGEFCSLRLSISVKYFLWPGSLWK